MVQLLHILLDLEEGTTTTHKHTTTIPTIYMYFAGKKMWKQKHYSSQVIYSLVSKQLTKPKSTFNYKRLEKRCQHSTMTKSMRKKRLQCCPSQWAEKVKYLLDL
jgi:hypothetical protein